MNPHQQTSIFVITFHWQAILWSNADLFRPANTLLNADGVSLKKLFEPIITHCKTFASLNQLSGGIVVGSVFHFLMGALGVVGFLSRYVGPLPVASVMGLIGISLYDMINIASRPSFPVAML